MPEQKEKKRSGPGATIAALASTILWLLGFVLAFVVPKGSKFIWVPDAMLLLGFWPLLYAWKAGWTWVLFGVSNMVVGFFLEVMVFLPDTNFTQEMIAVRKHLAEQHSALTWILIGALSTIFGGIRMITNLIRWIRARKRSTTG